MARVAPWLLAAVAAVSESHEPCMGASIDGECWILSQVGQSCADVCHGPTRVDAETSVGDATSERVVIALEDVYGLHDTSRDGLNMPCGWSPWWQPAGLDFPEWGSYVFVPDAFVHGEGRWHCIEGQTYRHVSAGVRSPGACWRLGGLGEGCEAVCGGELLVDAPLTKSLSSSTEIVAALAAQFGLGPPRGGPAFDAACEPPPNSAYSSARFLYFPEVDAWDCFPGESLFAIAPVFRAGCACLPPPAPPPPAPPPAPPAWYAGFCNSTAPFNTLGCAALSSLAFGFCLALCLAWCVMQCARARRDPALAPYYGGGSTPRYGGGSAFADPYLSSPRYKGSSFDQNYGYFGRDPYGSPATLFWSSLCCCRGLAHRLYSWCAYRCRAMGDALWWRCCYGGRGYYGRYDGAYDDNSWKPALSSPRGGCCRTSPTAYDGASWAGGDVPLYGGSDYGYSGAATAGEWARRPRLADLDGSTGYLYPGSYPGSARRVGSVRAEEWGRHKFDECYVSSPSTPRRPLSARRPPPALSPAASAAGRPFTTAEVHAAFDRFDSNRSGRLDYRELRNALQAFGLDVDSEEATSILQQYDNDGNGLLEVDEFRRLVERLYDLNGLDRSRTTAAPLPRTSPRSEPGGTLPTPPVGRRRGGDGGAARWSDAEVRAAFERFDANRSGRLDYRELRKALLALGGLDLDSEEATSILQQYDGDGNGLLDVHEFGELVRRLGALGALPARGQPSARAVRAALSPRGAPRSLAPYEERSAPEPPRSAPRRPAGVGGGTIWGGAGPPPPGKVKPPTQVFFPPATRASTGLDTRTMC